MLSNQEKFDILQRILDSKTFSKSTTANVLLKLLVEASINGKDLSASDIGLELFGSKYEHEKSEANVRVNIYHLRKKLQKYFDHEGAQDTVRLLIERGQYGISFVPMEEFEQQESDNKNSRQNIAPFLILNAVVALVVLVLLFFPEKKRKDNVWNPLFNNGLETHIYLGNLYGYEAVGRFGHGAWHRDFTIDSDEQLYEQIEKFPNELGKVKPAGLALLNFESAAVLKDIGLHFGRTGHDLSVKRLNDFDMKTSKDMNTIYAGPYKINPRSIRLFNDLSKNVKLLKNPKGKDVNFNSWYLKLTDRDSSVYLSARMNSAYDNYEYALVASLKGTNDTQHRMFFANHGMGLLAVVEYFSNPDSLEHFSGKYLKKNDEFVALFYVEGSERTNQKMKLHLIDHNF